MTKRKAITPKPEAKKENTKLASIRCTVNDVAFSAEGSPEEVSRKFSEFLDTMFSPLKEAIKKARTEGGAR